MIQKKIFFFLIVLPFTLFSQRNIEYLNYSNKAEFYFHNLDYDSSLHILKHAKKEFGNLNLRDFWIYIDITQKKGKLYQCYRALKKRIPNDNFSFSDISKYINYREYKFKDWQKRKLFKLVPDTNSQEYLLSQQVNLQLKEMKDAEQEIRLKVPSVNNLIYLKNDSIDYYEAIKLIDEDNAKKIHSLIVEKKLIERIYLDHVTLGTLLLHMSELNFNKIEPELINMINLGNLDPYTFAVAKDRKLSLSKSCFAYYAYTLFAENKDCIEYEDILENRKKIGLSIYYTRSSIKRIVPLGRQNKHQLDSFFHKSNKQ